MGLDYEYDLYFPRDALVDVLEAVCAIAWVGDDETVTLVLPDRTLSLPLSPVGGTGPRLTWDDPAPSWDVATSMCFERDEAIDEYLDRPGRFSSESGEDHRYDAEGRAVIGWIYLTIDRDLGERSPDPAADLVRFSFGTPGTTISVLFWESPSIRRTFIRLLETCHGVYGVLDREDEADLIWLRGTEVDDVVLPEADLPLAEIDEIVRSAGRGAPAPPAAPPAPAEATWGSSASRPTPAPVGAPVPRAAEENQNLKSDLPVEAWAAAPAQADDGVRDPSFWTPRNSTCDPRWRRLLDRFLMWLIYEPEAKPIVAVAGLALVVAAVWGLVLR